MHFLLIFVYKFVCSDLFVYFVFVAKEEISLLAPAFSLSGVIVGIFVTYKITYLICVLYRSVCPIITGRGSSVVEQRPEKPRVGSSILPPGTTSIENVLQLVDILLKLSSLRAYSSMGM